MYQKFIALFLTILFALIPKRAVVDKPFKKEHIILLTCPQCVTIDDDVEYEDCPALDPGIEPCVFLRDSCDTTIPDPDANTKTVSLPITVAGGASFFQFARIDKKQSQIDGEKALDSPRPTWTATLFVPGNTEQLQYYMDSITRNGFVADAIVTDKQGLQYIYIESEFSYTYTSNTDTSDAGEPGWTLTISTKQTPCLYTNVIP